MVTDWTQGSLDRMEENTRPQKTSAGAQSRTGDTRIFSPIRMILISPSDTGKYIAP